MLKITVKEMRERIFLKCLLCKKGDKKKAKGCQDQNCPLVGLAESRMTLGPRSYENLIKARAARKLKRQVVA